MRIITYLLCIIIVLTGITFAGLNAAPVTLNYYVGTAELPLSLLLVFTLISGCLLSFMMSLIIFFKLKRDNYRLRQRLKLVEAELANLRISPLKDAH